MKKAQIDTSLLKVKDFTIHFSKSPKDQIKINYLGSGGYFIENSKDAILIDPFFSHQPILGLSFKKIATDSLAVTAGLSPIRDEIKKVDGVFVSHTHYDHLMDVPYVFNHFLDTSRADLKIYGSKSMETILESVISPTHLEMIKPFLSDVSDTGKWIYLQNSTIRVLPIKTDHAPHLKKIIPIHFYKGEAKSIKGFQKDTDKTKARQWKGGDTFAFLIDFLEDEKIDFRIYVQSSSAAPTNGFVNEKVLSEAAVNLAILGSASFSNVKCYPNGIIDNITPEKIVICHWEDFFIPYQQSPNRLVRATNIRKFILKLNDKYPWKQNENEQFFMSEPGVSFVLD
jgi:hypothetical protein